MNFHCMILAAKKISTAKLVVGKGFPCNECGTS